MPMLLCSIIDVHGAVQYMIDVHVLCSKIYVHVLCSMIKARGALSMIDIHGAVQYD